VFERGAPCPFDAAALRAALERPVVEVELDLALGAHAATAWGCDMSAEYVRINAEYTT
jgi:glutamate N-acetyltransferase/amino-acid N-acetyltransferase